MNVDGPHGRPGHRFVRGIRVRLLSAITVVVALLVGVVLALPASTASAAPASAAVLAPAAGSATVTGVRQSKVIGYSVQHRAIVAYELGNPKAPTKDLILGSMHGAYERAGEQVIDSLKSIPIPTNLDLWAISTINPDGDALGQHANADGVDLNRNFGWEWAPISGAGCTAFDCHYSGPHPLSEPEDVAMLAFLKWLKPARVVSMHQPLYGIDQTDGGALPDGQAFRNALAANLNLPIKPFTCFGFCHGSMTGWLTHAAPFHSVAITVEFGDSPSSSYLQDQAARGILSALDVGVKPWTPPAPKAVKVSGFLDKATTAAGAIRVQGWSLDPAYSSSSNWVTVQLDGRTVAHLRANQVRADVNRRVHVVGRHGFVGTISATPGRHTVCVVGNKYASSSSKSVTLAQGCKSVTVPPFLLAGHVDQVTPLPGKIHVSGWAFDPQHRDATRTVRVLLDHRTVASVSTSVLRPTVNEGIHLTGRHGFDTTVNATPGRHTVQVVAVPTGAMTSHAKTLSTTTVTVPAA